MGRAQWMTTTSRKLLVFACVTAVVVASCASNSASTRSDSEGTSGRNTPVTIQTFQFRPTPLELKAGTRVTWTNQDNILHTVSSGAPDNRGNRFESPLDGKGATYSVVFTQAGTYPYFCDRHQSMRGEILVR
jgi:plastocyanin